MLSGRGQPFKRFETALAIDSAAGVVASAGVSQAEIRLRALRTTRDKEDDDGATGVDAAAKKRGPEWSIRDESVVPSSFHFCVLALPDLPTCNSHRLTRTPRFLGASVVDWRSAVAGSGSRLTGDGATTVTAETDRNLLEARASSSR